MAIPRRAWLPPIRRPSVGMERRVMGTSTVDGLRDMTSLLRGEKWIGSTLLSVRREGCSVVVPESRCWVVRWYDGPAGSGLPRGDQPAFVGEDHELHPVPHPELHQDPTHMGFHRRLAQKQLLADLGVGQTANHEGHDLTLPVSESAQPRWRGEVGYLRLPGEAFEEPAGHRRGEQGVAGMHHSYPGQDVGRRGVFEQETAGPGLQ